VSSLDDILSDLSRGVDTLSTRAASALFAASAAALLPAYIEWAKADRAGNDRAGGIPILERSIEIGFELARSGTSEADLPSFLQRLEWITPGRGRSTTASTVAQDCVVCADVAIRVHVEPQFARGAVIEYALEPILLAATARVAAEPVPDDGSGPPTAADALLEDAQVLAAVEFMWLAIMRLRSRVDQDPAAIDEIRLRAAVLLPRPAAPRPEMS
jgi:hypothetical protein